MITKLPDQKRTGLTNNCRLVYILGVAISLITVVVYLPSLQNDFINWDDDVVVVNNANIRTFNLTFLKWALSSVSKSFWQPVNWISYNLDRFLWGLKPSGYHLTSLCLHAVNTVLVTFLVVGFLEKVKIRLRPTSVFTVDRARLIAGAAAGLLFGIHPVHVEAVAWVASRPDLFCTLFSLLCVRSYANYAAEKATKTIYAGLWSLPANKHYFLAFMFFVLAMASKPMAVTIPFILLILDWYPFGRFISIRTTAAVFVEKIPFIILSFLLSVVTIISQKAFGVMSLMEYIPLAERVLVACRSLMTYLWKMLAPFDLLPLYPYPAHVSFWSINYALPVLLVVGITVAAVLAVKKQKAFPAAWAFFVVTLLPVLGIVSARTEPMADRYTYVSSLGPFVLMGLASAWVWERWTAANRWKLAIKAFLVIAAIGYAGTLAYLTIRQTSVWNNSVDFWTYIIRHEPDGVPIAYVNRGIALKEKGRHAQAMEDYSHVIALGANSPAVEMQDGEDGSAAIFDRGDKEYKAGITLKNTVYLAYNNRGVLYQDDGDLDRAIKDYDSAISLDPQRPMAYYNRGMLFARTGQMHLAIKDLTTAVELDPGYADAYTNRGWIYKNTGQIERGLSDYTAAIKAQPLAAEGYYNRGLMLGEIGQLDQALSDYSRAIELDPRYAAAYLNRGLLYEDLGRLNLALTDFNTAIAIDPDRPAAYNNRGVLYEMTNRLDRAVEDYSTAISLNPADHIASSNRGIALGKMGQYDKAIEDHSRAISIEPGHIRSYLERGDLYLRTGRRQLAMRDYQVVCDLGSEEGCAALRSNKMRQRP